MAIIAILVAISIPIFLEKLEQSREAVDIANLRDAYAYGQVEALSTGKGGSAYYDAKNGIFKATATSIKAYGKGTDIPTDITYDLPDACEDYQTGEPYTGKIIYVKWDEEVGVTICEFRAV